MGLRITEGGDFRITEGGDQRQTDEPITVTFSGTGITVVDITVLSDTSAIVDIDIAGGAAATARDVTVTNRLGTSEPFTFTVTASGGGTVIPVLTNQYRARTS